MKKTFVIGLLSLSLFSYYRFVHIYKLNEGPLHIVVRELSFSEYPDNPASLSKYYGKYGDRKITLAEQEDGLFDLLLHSDSNKNNAEISLRSIDLSLMVPKLPRYVKQNKNHEIISFVDREWNRQQVHFSRTSNYLHIQSGDGVEKKILSKVSLARNCLSAGLWEILLYFKEKGTDKLYYQGWFDFPKGLYKQIFEKNNNNTSYWEHFYRLEHWFDPAGAKIDLTSLRDVIRTHDINFHYNKNERVIIAGEQHNKIRTSNSSNIRTWNGLIKSTPPITYARFVPPGFYSISDKQKTKYHMISKFKEGLLREVKPKYQDDQVQEIELVYESKNRGVYRFIVSGVRLNDLPTTTFKEYHKGMYKPMGIGVPPFYQSYEQLIMRPPNESYYVSLILDENNEWVDHHSLGIDGPVMHKDKNNPQVFHLYLLSYERHTLIAHYVFSPTENMNLDHRKYMNKIEGEHDLDQIRISRTSR